MLNKQFVEAMGGNNEIIQTIQKVQLSPEEYQVFRQQLKENPIVFCEMIRKRQDYRQIFLYIYLRMAAEAEEEYEKRNIAKEIYKDTMKDILLWSEDCLEKYGEYGIEEAEWLWRHVTLRLFRLGRLQYEITKEKGVIELHIPKGESLLEAECIVSFQQACVFFEGKKTIRCHSWLLNPLLQQLLSPKSNIICFQKYFHVYQIDLQSRQAEERIFQEIKKNPSHYPQKTTLQKALKQWLLEKRNFGSAYGEIVWSRVYQNE